jgi:hypothetical protein
MMIVRELMENKTILPFPWAAYLPVQSKMVPECAL